MCFTPAGCPCLWSERLSASEFKCLKAVVYKTWWQMDDYASMLSAAIGGKPSHVELLKVVVEKLKVKMHGCGREGGHSSSARAAGLLDGLYA